MLGCGVSPDNFTFPSVVKACSALNNVRFGTLIHEVIMLMGFEVNVFISSSLISMLESNSMVANTLLSMYSKFGWLCDARKLFDMIPKADLVSWNGIISGDVEMARNVFNQSSKVDVVVCTIMISGYVLNGMNNEALEIFKWLLQEKIRPNDVTLASVLCACADLAALKVGKELNGNIIKNGLADRCHVGSVVIDMYAKCGRLDLAHHVFRRWFERDFVC
ncbi:hypothetical protein CRYUN_Cryun37aG0002700 [Craigia yunnanensis]